MARDSSIARLTWLFLTTLSVLGGCAHRQTISSPYPFWGEKISLPGTAESPSLEGQFKPSYSADPAACLLLVHGMNEYIGRYGEIAAHFAPNYHVAGIDLYAHGLSNPIIAAAEARLRQGTAAADVSRAYQAQASLRNLDLLRDNFARALRYLARRCPEKPVFILAHSLGGLVAASHFMQSGANKTSPCPIGGIVLLGPAFSVPDIPGWRGWLQNPLIQFSFFAESNFLYRGDDPLPWFLAKQIVAVPATLLLRGTFEAASWPGIRALTTPVTPPWVPFYLSDWEVEQARHLADGYIIRRTLPRFAKGVEREIVRFRRHMEKFDLPYLLVYSGHDPITAARGNEEFIQATRTNHPDNQVMALEAHSHHEHLFSSPPLRREILRRIDGWIEKRLE
ncbi:alpha/beta fold hydrolase [Methylohalobius crimeensis]|uniref:alpha/beta fold hydrolase n=1 Tax=Methylohalobius crimeensis TaxID=244365 RepID=UPI0003B7B93F|nr:alpha/beta fold hydrolase [Methylohalobius crimeensis]